MRRDPWIVLGLTRGASADEVRRAFRRLAWELHPDRRPEDPAAETRFKELVEALGALSARGARDGGPAARATRSTTERSAGRPGWAGERVVARKQGFDVAADYEISLMEALRGGSHPVRLHARMPCAVCGPGSRRKAGCRACHGTGATLVARRLVLRLPAGVRDGDIVTAAGGGAAASTDGRHGTLRVRIAIRTPPGLRIDQNDVHLDLPLTVSEAFFGSRLTVPTPTGDVLVTVPPIIGSVPLLRVRGRGLPPRAGRAGDDGDLLLHPVIVLPARRDAVTRSLVRRLADADTEDPRAALRRTFA